MIPLLLGPLRPYLIGSAAVVTLLFGAWVWMQHHDHLLEDRWRASQAAAVAAAQDDMRSRVDAALSAQEAAMQDQIEKLSQTKARIAHAPITTTCASSPAIGAALDSLRAKADAGHR